MQHTSMHAVNTIISRVGYEPNAWIINYFKTHNGSITCLTRARTHAHAHTHSVVGDAKPRRIGSRQNEGK